MPRQAYEPYNPLDKSNLGTSVADALLSRRGVDLPPGRFLGAGVYAIYYAGSFEPYQSVAALDQDDTSAVPVYVGKAVPSGARKGGYGLDANPGTDLHKRLREHATSIEQANNIELADCWCRYLVVDDIWVPLGESLLINRFSPVWNTVVDGFGNHAPGRGRLDQARSRWDVLHPGRPWADKLRENDSSAEDITTLVTMALAEDQ